MPDAIRGLANPRVMVANHAAPNEVVSVNDRGRGRDVTFVRFQGLAHGLVAITATLASEPNQELIDSNS